MENVKPCELWSASQITGKIPGSALSPTLLSSIILSPKCLPFRYPSFSKLSWFSETYLPFSKNATGVQPLLWQDSWMPKNLLWILNFYWRKDWAIQSCWAEILRSCSQRNTVLTKGLREVEEGCGASAVKSSFCIAEKALWLQIASWTPVYTGEVICCSCTRRLEGKGNRSSSAFLLHVRQREPRTGCVIEPSFLQAILQ